MAQYQPSWNKYPSAPFSLHGRAADLAMVSAVVMLGHINPPHTFYTWTLATSCKEEDLEKQKHVLRLPDEVK